MKQLINEETKEELDLSLLRRLALLQLLHKKVLRVSFFININKRQQNS